MRRSACADIEGICKLVLWYASATVDIGMEFFMHRDHDIFVQGIQEKRRVKLTYFNNEHKLNLARLCIPLYYSQGRAEGDDSDCYYLWDFDSSVGKRFLALPPSRVVSIEPTEEFFVPGEYIILGRNLAETKAGQYNNGDTADSKGSTSMKPAPEKDSGIAKLAEHRVNKIRQTRLFKKKEQAEDSNNTAGLNANTEKEN